MKNIKELAVLRPAFFHLIAGEEVCGLSYLIAVGLLRAQMNNSVSRDSGRGTLRDSDDGYYCI